MRFFVLNTFPSGPVPAYTTSTEDDDSTSRLAAKHQTLDVAVPSTLKAIDLCPYPPLEELDAELNELKLELVVIANVLDDSLLVMISVLEDDFDEEDDGELPLDDDDDEERDDEDDEDEGLLAELDDEDLVLADDDLLDDERVDSDVPDDRDAVMDEELADESDIVTLVDDEDADAVDIELRDEDVLLENDDRLERLDSLLVLMLLVLLELVAVMSFPPLLCRTEGRQESPDIASSLPCRRPRRTSALFCLPPCPTG